MRHRLSHGVRDLLDAVSQGVGRSGVYRAQQQARQQTTAAHLVPGLRILHPLFHSCGDVRQSGSQRFPRDCVPDGTALLRRRALQRVSQCVQAGDRGQHRRQVPGQQGIDDGHRWLDVIAVHRLFPLLGHHHGDPAGRSAGPGGGGHGDQRPLGRLRKLIEAEVVGRGSPRCGHGQTHFHCVHCAAASEGDHGIAVRLRHRSREGVDAGHRGIRHHFVVHSDQLDPLSFKRPANRPLEVGYGRVPDQEDLSRLQASALVTQVIGGAFAQENAPSVELEEVGELSAVLTVGEEPAFTQKLRVHLNRFHVHLVHSRRKGTAHSHPTARLRLCPMSSGDRAGG